MRILLAVVLCGAAPVTSAAQETAVASAIGPDVSTRLAAAVDSIFSHLDRADGPGAAVAIVRDGAVVLQRGYGRAQLEYDVAITPATIFHVASVSKQFTAFGVLLLAHEGLLSLDDDIRAYLPELADFGQRVTIRHLIHHTSGIRDQWELLLLAGWRLDDVITRDQVMALARRQRELNFEPGSEYLYSNMGYSLLAEIVERVSGQSFGGFLQQRVFDPLAMESTHVHSDHQMVVPGRAYFYRPSPDGWSAAVLSYANQGATSLFTTVGDLAKWLTNFETAQVGGAAAIAQMFERGVLNSGDTIPYAFAMIRSELGDRTLWQHSGSDAGFRAQVAYFPEERVGIVVLSNASNGNPGTLMQQVARAYLGLDEPVAAASGPPPSASRAPEEPPPLTFAELRGYAGDYYSPELGTVYTLEMRGDSLVATHFRIGDMRVAAIGADTLRIGSRTAAFQRDAAGAVTAFRLTGSRVRNLLFVRLADGAIPHR
jgi:CubicO group peptidase (beta-lactamase class C family)